MEYKKGADVISSDGVKIGNLDRVVMNPTSKEAAYLVVRSGLLLTEDKLIPIKEVSSVDQGQVKVTATSDQVDSLPKYQEVEYISIDHEGSPDEAELNYWYPPASGWSSAGRYNPFPQPMYVERVGKNIHEGMVAVKEGAKVVANDAKYVGNIEKMITDEGNNYITHIVVSSGLIFPERKLIPAYWLTAVSEEEVHVAVDTPFLEHLPDYKEVG